MIKDINKSNEHGQELIKKHNNKYGIQAEQVFKDVFIIENAIKENADIPEDQLENILKGGLIDILFNTMGKYFNVGVSEGYKMRANEEKPKNK